MLVDPLYRRGASWTAIAGSGLLGIMLSQIIDGLAGSGYGILANTSTALTVEGITWGLSFLALFGWLYTSANVALSSDFFHRDVLSWNRGGRIVFAVVIAGAYVLASFPPPSNPAPLADFNTFSNLVGPIFAVGLLYGGAVIVITYRRIKDRVIRNYSKWVAASLGSTFLWILSGEPYTFAFFSHRILHVSYCRRSHDEDP